MKGCFMNAIAPLGPTAVPISPYLGDVCVLGLGATGRAVATYLLELGPTRVRSVTVVGGKKSQEGPLAQELRDAGACVLVGTEDLLGTYDLAVVSPGISEFSDFFANAKAHAHEVIGEPEFAWRESPERWIGITGTNGKTTTTSLACELLKSSGIGAVAVGNIGTNVVTQIAERDPQTWFVAELSSFQLATTSKLHPRVACLLNVTPDHGEWHKTFENYLAAKEKIFANLDEGDLAILDVDDPHCAALARQLDDRGLVVCRVSASQIPDSPCRAYVDDGLLVVELIGERYELVAVSDLRIEGPHNVANGLAASAAALFAGASVKGVRQGLKAFAPLEHRIEPVATIDGVRYINDSKATNTDAVVTALRAFEPGRVILLAGGHDKGGQLDEFVDAIKASCKATVTYGEASDRFFEALSGQGLATLLQAPHMAEALTIAKNLAVPGDVVLLSPACSSYDEFSGFEERGCRFKELVLTLDLDQPGH